MRFLRNLPCASSTKILIPNSSCKTGSDGSNQHKDNQHSQLQTSVKAPNSCQKSNYSRFRPSKSRILIAFTIHDSRLHVQASAPLSALESLLNREYFSHKCDCESVLLCVQRPTLTLTLLTVTVTRECDLGLTTVTLDFALTPFFLLDRSDAAPPFLNAVAQHAEAALDPACFFSPICFCG